MEQAVIGVATNEMQAELMIKRLRISGFPDEDISIALPCPEGTIVIAYQQISRMSEDEFAETGFGGMIVRVFELAGRRWGVGCVPGPGAFIAAGPLLDALGGPGIEHISDGLESIGIPEDEASRCEEQIRNGRILLVAHFEDPRNASRAWMSFLESGTGNIRGIGVPMPPYFTRFVPWPGE